MMSIQSEVQSCPQGQETGVESLNTPCIFMYLFCSSNSVSNKSSQDRDLDEKFLKKFQVIIKSIRKKCIHQTYSILIWLKLELSLMVLLVFRLLNGCTCIV